ncbi:MAG TPA: hypothetical protein VFD21_00020 [Vicinamibacterales bacterium]|nr:hypothetical protein [Vicinamibacterales bacterium]
MQHATFKLVEELSGTGDLEDQGTVLRRVRYSVARYQGMLVGSGMPIPGVHRIEGSTDFEVTDVSLIGRPLTLRLEDGRALGVVLAGRDGRLLSEGHGPSRCLCC